MAVTAISATPSDLSSSPTRRVARVAVAVVVAGVLVAECAMTVPPLLTGVHGMVGSSMGWLLIAAMFSGGSMVAFGAVRRVTLQAGGVHVSLPAAVAVSYAAGAIHACFPAGGVFSSVYAFRRIRTWGASTALATWSMAITGLLATATLATVGLAGLVLAGGSPGSAAASILEIAAIVGVAGFLAHIIRRPETLLTVAGVGLQLTNRLRKRRAETGYAAVLALVADLRSVRPARRHWAGAVTLSLLNWVLDLACLAACCAAFGIHLTPAALLLTYSVGMAASSLSPLPAGLGVTEGTLALGLVATGAPAAAALATVIVYRLLSIGSIVLVGWIILFARRNRAAGRFTAPQPEPVPCDSPFDGDQRVGHSVEADQSSGRTPRWEPPFVLATTAEGPS